jgi:hypothetical protein
MRKLTFSAAFVVLALMVAVSFGFARREARPADLLEILPDGSGVAVIDFQKITGSALWTTVSAQQKLARVIDKAQSEIADLGLKLNDVHTVVLVFPSYNLNNPTVAMNGAFDQKVLLDRLRSSPKIKLASDKYKGFDVYTARSIPPSDVKSSSGSMSANAAAVRNETSFAFRDAGTIVIGATESVHASIDVMTGARPSITQNSQLADGLAQNPSAAIRFAIVVTPSAAKGLQSSELPIPDFSSLRFIYGAIDVASGIDLNVTLRGDNAESAKSIADRLNGLLGMARGYLGAANNPKSTAIVDALKSVTITSSNNDVKITGSLTADLLSNLFASAARKSQ